MPYYLLSPVFALAIWRKKENKLGDSVNPSSPSMSREFKRLASCNGQNGLDCYTLSGHLSTCFDTVLSFMHLVFWALPNLCSAVTLFVRRKKLSFQYSSTKKRIELFERNFICKLTKKTTASFLGAFVITTCTTLICAENRASIINMRSKFGS